MRFMRLLRRKTTPSDTSGGPVRRIFDLTWSIPQEYGGLTKVMLRRSRNFVRLSGLDVDILTLDYKLDVAEARARLEAAGEMVDGMHLRNAWDEVSAFDRKELRSLGGLRGVGGVPKAAANWDSTVEKRYIEYTDAHGEIMRVDHLRGDGSVYLADDRSGPVRRLILVDEKGHYVAEFNRARDFYFAWLDKAIGDGTAVLINESKYIATFLHRYHRENVRLGQVLHNTHIEPRATNSHGPFTKSRLEILKNWHKFDFLIFLTEKQKQDFVESFGDSPNLYVIPNSTSVDGTESFGSDQRPANQGVVVARLTGQKRVDHAISAVGRVDSAVQLDIVGDGDRRDELEKVVAADPVLADRVSFKGYVDNAAEELKHYSFILLTSSFEGMGVVLIEAMAQGCIPIAYDVRYGPSDIVDDGVNGYLASNVDGIAGAITKLIGLSPSEITAMRTEAAVKARTFSDESVTARWMDLLGDVTKSRRRPTTAVRSTVIASEVSVAGEHLRLRLKPVGELTNAHDARIVLSARDSLYSFSSPIEDQCSFPLADIAKLPKDAILDAWLQHWDGSGIARHRVACSSMAVDGAHGRIRPYRTVKGNLSIKIV